MPPLTNALGDYLVFSFLVLLDLVDFVTEVFVLDLLIAELR